MLLQLQVETFRGPVGAAPALQLAAWLLWDGPGRPWRLTVVERDAALDLRAREGALAKEDVDRLEAGLARAGPRVSAKVDTSDTSGQVRIRGVAATTTPYPFEIVVPMLSSGFEGPDADALRDVLRLFLDLAEVRSPDVRQATLGER